MTACIRLPHAARGAIVALALALGAECSANPPQRLVVHYDVSYNGAVVAEGVETLEHDGKSYVIRSETKGKGLFALLHRGTIRRSSRGLVVPGGLQPLEFLDQRGERPAESARFDWAAMTVTQQRSDGERRTIGAAEGMQDRLSFLWNFAFAPPQGREVSATIVDGRGTTVYRYAVADRQVLKTPAGELRTLRLVKQLDPGDDRRTEVWLAIERDLVPVRVLVVEGDGTRMDTILKGFGS